LNRQLGNRVREARALFALGTLESMQRAFQAALPWYEQALSMRRTIGDRAGVGAGLLALAQTCGALGDHGEALPLLQEALAIQQAIQNRWEECLVWNELGILRMTLGEYGAADSALEQGLAVARAIGSEIGVAYLTCNLGQVQRERGHLATAATTLRTGLALAIEQEDTGLEATYCADLALTLLQLGRYDEAQEVALRALQINRELEQETAQTFVHATLAQASSKLGDSAASLEHARTGMEILSRSDGIGVDFPVRDAWMCAEVLEQGGATFEAVYARSSAARWLSEKAARISDETLRAAYLSNVPLHRTILAWSA
ncbi:MAG: tetratricopeptide repeat protein, partial [Caldilineaceae bacterium]